VPMGLREVLYRVQMVLVRVDDRELLKI
jgi:hypothetical protein